MRPLTQFLAALPGTRRRRGGGLPLTRLLKAGVTDDATPAGPAGQHGLPSTVPESAAAGTALSAPGGGGRVRRLARLLSAVPVPGRRRRDGALARLGEREARDVLAMPQGHPENLTRPLRRADERMLAALRGELWPDDEYAREI